MNPQVKRFLDEHQSVPIYQHQPVNVVHPEKWETYKQEVLLLAGLYHKVYGVTFNREFPHVEEDIRTGRLRYYKKQPILVTEEEFKLIQQYSPIAYNE